MKHFPSEKKFVINILKLKCLSHVTSDHAKWSIFYSSQNLKTNIYRQKQRPWDISGVVNKHEGCKIPLNLIYFFDF